ncbi:hypothetical protein SISNIDRAFT_550843 [Sistotremastrum niveocremeum HHB9708]|uniref:Uncharacterized protein n=1 Tax=Sistotremastrum niveocremeum HHB9708 TaxID=1314777 RepID=A0A164SUF3_9AGAM|nr:hypothetical protein SISNIDRAFT_550843 [Sistotremastrum niveocremeum HHB9708]
MSTISAEAASDIVNYLESHALPDGRGYVVVEQAIGAKLPFAFEQDRIHVSGVLDMDDHTIAGDIEVQLPLWGWKHVFHFYGMVIEGPGAVFPFDLVLISGSITFKYQWLQGMKWLILILDVKALGQDYHDTRPLFPVPFLTSNTTAIRLVGAPSANGTGPNPQWLQQLHLYSKVALDNGGVFPETATVRHPC